MELWNAVTDRQVLIFLAVLSASIYTLRRQWENVTTRLIVAIAYFLAVSDIVEDHNVSMFLIRWSMILLFVVEIVRYILEWIFRRFRESITWR